MAAYGATAPAWPTHRAPMAEDDGVIVRFPSVMRARQETNGPGATVIRFNRR